MKYDSVQKFNSVRKLHSANASILRKERCSQTERQIIRFRRSQKAESM